MSRYLHAPPDAPLYRVLPQLGGRVWPAYRVYDDNIVLDVDGELVTFKPSQAVLIAQPLALPDWAWEVLAGAIAADDGNYAIPQRLEAAVGAIPVEVRDYALAIGGAR